LNNVSIGTSFPIPNISDILDSIGKAEIFTSLDLCSGFYQIRLREEDKEKTAFSSNDNHWQYVRMPMGLKGAPSTFQKLMNTTLSGLQGTTCFAYLDDALISGKTIQEHNDRLRQVFTRFREASLQLQPDKCEFSKREVKYLGFVITGKGLKPDRQLVEKVLDFPVPKTVKEVKSFCGLSSYYRRFIPNYSKISTPLNKLLRKDVPFIWGEKEQNAMDSLKKILTTYPILQHPDVIYSEIMAQDRFVQQIAIEVVPNTSISAMFMTEGVPNRQCSLSRHFAVRKLTNG
jgi:hypothetical protein